MKIFLIILIIFAFTIIGILIYLNYKKKRMFYSELIDFCNKTIADIKFTKTNLKQIILKYISNYTTEIKDFLDAKLTDVNYISKNLSINQNLEIQNFFNELGKYDVDGEINNLNKYKSIFEEKEKNALIDEKQKGVLKCKLFIILGLIVSIILI